MLMEKMFHTVQPCFCELVTLSADQSLTLHAIHHAVSHALTRCVLVYYVRGERSEGFLYDFCFVCSLVAAQPMIILDTDETDWTDFH